MNITVIGSGNGGTAVAADLAAKHHQVTLFKSSKKGNTRHFQYLLDTDGKVKLNYPDGKSITTEIALVTQEIDQALTQDTELVIIFLPTTYQEKIIQTIAPYLHDNQMILLEPGYLGTAYFMKHIPNIDLTIVEAESSPLDCRITAEGEVTINFMNCHNPIGVYPVERSEQILEKLSVLSYSFILRHNVVEAALHNPNLIVHTVGGIMSIPRIEYTHGDYWMYKEVFTPTVWHLINQLDEEKMNVMAAMGLPRVSYLAEAKVRNAPSDTWLTSKEVFDDYAQNHSVKGPDVSDSRYIREDVPQGLGLLQSLGKYYGVSTNTCDSLIQIASVFMEADYEEQVRTVEKLGKEHVEKLIEDKTNVDR